MDISIEGGYIKVKDGYEHGDGNFHIESIKATYGVDREDTPGIYRMTNLELNSPADSNINEEAQRLIWNHLCDREYNNADDSGSYRKEAKQDIMQFIGVQANQVVIK